MRNIIILLGILILIGVVGFVMMSKPFKSTTRADVSELESQCLQEAFEPISYSEDIFAPYRGRIIVANSWASWCPYCVNELPDFAQVQSEYSQDVVILAINRQESKNVINNFVCELGVKDSLVYVLDPRDEFAVSIDRFAMPETVIYDAQGELVDHKRGPMNADELRKRIESFL
jgi:thiol-disulfide isomerase/thioredoxin